MKADPKGTSTEPRWHTVKRVATRWGISERSVHRWINKGLLRCHRFGRTIRISEDDLIAFEKESRG